MVFIAIERLGEICEFEASTSGAISWSKIAVCKRADALRSAGLNRQDPILISQAGSIQFFTDLLAVWMVGGIAVCLDPSLTKVELANVARFVGAKFILLDRDNSDDDWPVSPLRSGLAGTETPLETNTSGGALLDDPALLLFTSGTTGDPKGVVHTYRSVLSRISINGFAIGLNASDVALLTLPVHFGHGLIGNALSPLFAGAKLVVAAGGIALGARLGSVIDLNGVTFLSSVPALWRMATKLSPKPKRGTLRRVHVGSAPLSSDLMRKIEDWAGCEVHNCYGITETANWIGSAASGDPLMRDGFVGRPWAGTAAVLSSNGHIAATGEGEILVQTPTLMSSYFARPELTAAAFVDGWYRTGDWGTVDNAGNICLSGRVKDEINRAGFKVQPAEVDMLLERHENVEEACAFGIPDVVGSEIVAVAVKLKERERSTPESLRAWCLEKMRRDAVPERWFIVDEIPKTSRGKLKRDQVRRILMEELG